MKKIVLDRNCHEIVAQECAEALKESARVLLLPTETVYGLACSWNDEAAKERIFAMKRRPPEKSLQMLVSGVEMVRNFGGIIDDKVMKLCSCFCPGPITIVVNSSIGGSIGFRIPDCALVLAILEFHGRPLAATSANISGMKAPVSLDDALSSLAEMPDIAVDGGTINSGGAASTVVSLCSGSPEILREGPISIEEIGKALRD